MDVGHLGLQERPRAHLQLRRHTDQLRDRPARPSRVADHADDHDHELDDHKLDDDLDHNYHCAEAPREAAAPVTAFGARSARVVAAATTSASRDDLLSARVPYLLTQVKKRVRLTFGASSIGSLGAERVEFLEHEAAHLVAAHCAAAGREPFEFSFPEDLPKVDMKALASRGTVAVAGNADRGAELIDGRRQHGGVRESSGIELQRGPMGRGPLSQRAVVHVDHAVAEPPLVE
jgi:hypothetical protein